MGFPMADIIVSTIIADGFQNLREDPSILDDVFSNLAEGYAARKYGRAEIDRIKQKVLRREFGIVHAYHPGEAQLPCLTVALSDDMEDKPHAGLGDHYDFVEEDITDPDELADLRSTETFAPVSSSAITGQVEVPLSVSLSSVVPNQLLIDALGIEHVVLAVVDLPASRLLFVPRGETVAAGPAYVRSSLNFKRTSVHAIIERAKVSVGVHADDALTCKYLYVLVKYFFLSRKKDMEKRGFKITSHVGSDFARDHAYQGDMVFTRFLQLEGEVSPCWRQDKVRLVESISVRALVPAGPLTDAQLGREDQTVRQNDKE